MVPESVAAIVVERETGVRVRVWRVCCEEMNRMGGREGGACGNSVAKLGFYPPHGKHGVVVTLCFIIISISICYQHREVHPIFFFKVLSVSSSQSCS